MLKYIKRYLGLTDTSGTGGKIAVGVVDTGGEP
jgi:hypothetical protein